MLLKIFDFLKKKAGDEIESTPPAPVPRIQNSKRIPDPNRCPSDQVTSQKPFQQIAIENYQTALKGHSIAAKWSWPGGDCFVIEHEKLDGSFFALRSSWVMERGFINNGHGIYESRPLPGMEHGCRCSPVYLRHLRDLPDWMLTEKGREALVASRIKITQGKK